MRLRACSICRRHARRGGLLCPRTESEAFGWCCRGCWQEFTTFEEHQEYLLDGYGRQVWLMLDPDTALVVDTEDLQVIRSQLDQLGQRVRELSPPAARMAMNRYSVFGPPEPLLFRDRASALQHIAEQVAASLQRGYDPTFQRYELATFGQGSGLVLEKRFGDQLRDRQSQDCWLLDTEGALYNYCPFHR